MRTSAWIMIVGLFACLPAGCSTPRMGMAKSEPPAAAAEERVKYGMPWGSKSKEEREQLTQSKEGSKSGSKELPPELTAKLAEARAARNGKSPKVTETLRKAGEAEARGDLEVARAAYMEVLAQSPKNAEAHHRLGVIADMNQDSSTADKHYQEALAANPNDADLLSDIGYSLYLRGQYDAAESRLKQALEKNQYHRSAQTNLGLVYGKQGKYDASLAMFRQSGTESEAQRNIAALFPKGRPGGEGPSLAGGAVQPAGNRSNMGTPGQAPPFPSDAETGHGTADPMQFALQQHLQTQTANSASAASRGQAPMFGQAPMSGAANGPNGNASTAGNWPGMTAANSPSSDWGGAAAFGSGATSPGRENPVVPAAANGSWPEVPATAFNTAQNRGTQTAMANNSSADAFWQGAFAGGAGNETAAVNSASIRAAAPFPEHESARGIWPATVGGQNSTVTENATGANSVQQTGFAWAQQSPPGGTAPASSWGAPATGNPSQWAAQMAMGTGPGTMFPQSNNVTAPNAAASNTSSVNPWGTTTNGSGTGNSLSPSNPAGSTAQWGQPWPGSNTGASTGTSNSQNAMKAPAGNPFGSPPVNAPLSPQQSWQTPATQFPVQQPPASQPTTSHWNQIAPQSPWDRVAPVSGWESPATPSAAQQALWSSETRSNAPMTTMSANGSLAPIGRPAGNGPAAAGLSDLALWPSEPAGNGPVSSQASPAGGAPGNSFGAGQQLPIVTPGPSSVSNGSAANSSNLSGSAGSNFAGGANYSGSFPNNSVGSAPSTNSSTVPNWPYAPSRP